MILLERGHENSGGDQGSAAQSIEPAQDAGIVNRLPESTGKKGVQCGIHCGQYQEGASQQNELKQNRLMIIDKLRQKGDEKCNAFRVQGCDKKGAVSQSAG